MRQRLSAAQVAELAELLEDGTWRIGPVDEVLQAAAEGRGMTLVLADLPGRGRPSRPAGTGTAAGQSRRRGRRPWPPP